MKFVDTFEHHKNTPKQSAHDYYRSLRLALSEQVLDRKIVYLDTKFWVLMRKGYLDPISYKLENELLNLAIQLSSKQLCIFPISEDVFLEVIKQTDETTLNATVELIDKLSNGVSSISSEERIKLELLHYWYSISGRSVYSTRQLVWTKLSYLMGMQQFESPDLSIQDNLILQKSFIDQMWFLSLNQMISIVSKSNETKPDFNIKMANKLNDGKFEHSNEANSFNQMFLNEVGGMVDAYGDDLAEMMNYIHNKETGTSLSEGRIENNSSQTKVIIGDVIYNLFRLNKITMEMPSINILSSLHAAVRWDKLQKYQDNDFHDFRHATTALPYCDYFFTERRLMHLVTQKVLSFDKLYKCEVQATVSKAIVTLTSLLQNEDNREAGL